MSTLAIIRCARGMSLAHCENSGSYSKAREPMSRLDLDTYSESFVMRVYTLQKENVYVVRLSKVQGVDKTY